MLQVLVAGFLQLVAIAVDRGGEVEQGEPVVGPEVVQAILEGLAGLVHLGAAHAARRVQHQHHVPGHLVLPRSLHARRQQHHEVAVLGADGPVVVHIVEPIEAPVAHNVRAEHVPKRIRQAFAA